MVGFHVAEVCERTIPLAPLTAALGDMAPLAPLAMAPGMFARYLARRLRTSGSSSDGGMMSAVKTALKFSLVRVWFTLRDTLIPDLKVSSYHILRHF